MAVDTIFRVSMLPKVNGRTLRAFEGSKFVLPSSSRKCFNFRGGMTMESAGIAIARKGMHISASEFMAIAGSDRHLNRHLLIKGIKNLDNSEIIDKIGMREENSEVEYKSLTKAERLAAEIMWRTGDERDVLDPFDIGKALAGYKNQPQEFGLLAKSYMNFLGRERIEYAIMHDEDSRLALAIEQGNWGHDLDNLLISVVAENLRISPERAMASMQLDSKDLKSLEKLYLDMWIKNLHKEADHEFRTSFLGQMVKFIEIE